MLQAKLRGLHEDRTESRHKTIQSGLHMQQQPD